MQIKSCLNEWGYLHIIIEPTYNKKSRLGS